VKHSDFLTCFWCYTGFNNRIPAFQVHSFRNSDRGTPAMTAAFNSSRATKLNPKNPISTDSRHDPTNGTMILLPSPAASEGVARSDEGESCVARLERQRGLYDTATDSSLKCAAPRTGIKRHDSVHQPERAI
jgi:hypothetical protein